MTRSSLVSATLQHLRNTDDNGRLWLIGVDSTLEELDNLSGILLREGIKEEISRSRFCPHQNSEECQDVSGRRVPGLQARWHPLAFKYSAYAKI